MSEKMDGIRACWNGERLLSKSGREIACPRWFTASLPSGTWLDGELWMGRGSFERLLSTVNSPEGDWGPVKYVAFDLPRSQHPIEERVAQLRGLKLPPHASTVDYHKCADNDHLLQALRTLVGDGGEGFMLCMPGSLYVPQRTESLLKVKVAAWWDRTSSLQMHNYSEAQVLEVLGSGLYCLQ